MTPDNLDNSNLKTSPSEVKIEEKLDQNEITKKSQIETNYYSYVVLIAAFLISVIVDGCIYSFGLLLSDIESHYRVTQGTVNLISSLNTGCVQLSGIIVSCFSNQFGCRSIVMIGAIFSSLAYLVCLFASNIYIMMIGYGIIGGFAMGATYIPSIIIVALYFDKRRGIATGITMAGSGIGGAIFAKLTAYLLDKFEWRLTSLILSGIMLQCFILGALLRPIEVNKEKETKKTIEMKKLDESTVIEYKQNKFHVLVSNILKELSSFKLLKTNIQFLIITISNFFVFSVHFIPFIYVPKRADELGLKGDLLLGIIGIVNIPARILFGLIADKKFFSTLHLNSISLAFCTLTNLIQNFLYNEPLQYLYSIMYAIGMAGLNSITSIYLCEIVGLEFLSNSFGILCVFRGVACLIGPFIAGIISDFSGKLTSAFIFTGCQYAIGLLFSILATFTGCMKLRKHRVDTHQCTNL